MSSCPALCEENARIFICGNVIKNLYVSTLAAVPWVGNLALRYLTSIEKQQHSTATVCC